MDEAMHSLSTTLILWGSDTKKSFPSTAAFLAAGAAAGFSETHVSMFRQYKNLKIVINILLYKTNFKCLGVSEI